MREEKSMQAAWYEKQGAAQKVIQYGETSIPQPDAGEVRVKVFASGVNPSDTKVRSGWGGIPQMFDRVIDVNFSANLPITSQVISPNGVITTYSGGKPDEQPALPSLLLLMNAVTIRFVFVYIMPEENKQSAIQDITKALEAGALHHNIARRFPLSKIAIAHDLQDSGQAIGKVILEIA